MSLLRWLAAFLILATETSLATSFPISFDAPRDYRIGAVSVAAGDFNRDGRPDVVSAGSIIWLLLGNGDASLQPPVQVASGRATFLGIVAGDFNGDQNPDLAAALNDAAGEVFVLPGNGDGTFQPAISYPVGGSPRAIVTADFNGDLVPDLATANSTSDNGSLLLGNGDGTFQPASAVDIGPGPTSLVVSDFNGDSKVDLAATNLWVSRVSIALGDGAGGFQPAMSFVTDSAPYAAAAGDFNSDQKSDLVLLSPHEDRLMIYAGNGDGTFSAAAFWGVTDEPASVAVADFNGDSRADFAVMGHASSSVVVNLGDQEFEWSAVREKPYGFALADFDGDSRVDLAVGSFDTSIVGIVRGTGDGRFATTRIVAEEAICGAADFNNDGKHDLAGLDGVLLGNGDGSFQPRIDYPQGCGHVADVNGDLKADLIRPQDTGVSVALGNGDGTFGPPSAFPTGPKPRAIAVADFDGNGTMDLAVGNSGERPFPSPPWGGSIVLLLGRGDGTFAAATVLTAFDYPGSIVTGDFNGDSLPDLAATKGQWGYPVSGSVYVFLNKGNGTFQAGAMTSEEAFPCGLVAADFNGDLRSDLLVSSCGGGKGGVAVLLGSSAGTFQVADSFVSGWGLIADFDGDGDLDLASPVSGSQYAGRLEVRAGNGDGTFGPVEAIFNLLAYPGRLTVADFTGDSKPDIVYYDRDIDYPHGYRTRLLTNTTPWPLETRVAEP